MQRTDSTRRLGKSGGPRPKNTRASRKPVAKSAGKPATKSIPTPVTKKPVVRSRLPAAAASLQINAGKINARPVHATKFTGISKEKRDPAPEANVRAPKKGATVNSTAPKAAPRASPAQNETMLANEGNTYVPSSTIRQVNPVRIISEGPTSIEIIEDCIKEIDCSGVRKFGINSARALMTYCVEEGKPMAQQTITEGASCVREAAIHAENAKRSLPKKSRNCAIAKEIMTLPVEDCRTPQHNKEENDAVDLWSCYRGTCGSLTTKWKYDDGFRMLRNDPLYPYLYTCSGVNDVAQGDSRRKLVQVCRPEDVYSSLAKKAKEAQPQLVDICKTLAKRLKLSKIGVGPIKEESAAIAKAERKYGGNLSNITDYCRAFVVVEDIALLLALLEYVCEHFGSSVCRIKLSSLQDDPLPGGYRDCKINLMVRGHIVEIQVHLSPLYSLCGVDGYQHYHDCLRYNTDRFRDPLELLNGLDQKTMGEMAEVAGDDNIKVTSVDTILRDDEEKIVDYFAIAGLLQRLEESFQAEVILRKLINLRAASDHTHHMTSNHSEVLHLKRSLETVLRQQNLIEEADIVGEQREKDGEYDTLSSVRPLCSYIYLCTGFFFYLIRPNLIYIATCSYRSLYMVCRR